MQRRIILIFCLLLLGGCKLVNEDNNYINNVYNCLKDKSITNNVALGYKYYVPKGVKKVKDYDYNQVFLVDDTYLYLYVDIISFYHDKKLQELDKSNAYYYEKFEYNGKLGYILIEESDSQYYLNIVYNYSKIEGYVSPDKVNKMITLSSIILNSVSYNRNTIEKVLEGDLGQFSEFTYEVKKPEGAKDNFSQYLEEYVQKDDDKEEESKTEQLPDE